MEAVKRRRTAVEAAVAICPRALRPDLSEVRTDDRTRLPLVKMWDGVTAAGPESATRHLIEMTFWKYVPVR